MSAIRLQLGSPDPSAPQGASPTASPPDTAARTLAPQGTERAAASAAAKKPAPYTTELEAIAKRYYVEDRGNERRYYDLSAAQKHPASAPEPARDKPAPAQARRMEPEPPWRSLSR